MRALLIVVVILVLIPVVAYMGYVPEDHCKEAEFWKEITVEKEVKLGMTYLQYIALDRMEQLYRMKEDIEYLDLEASGKKMLEEKVECIATIGKSKYERFVDAVYTGQLFK